MSTTVNVPVDLDPRPLDVTRLPLRRRVDPTTVDGLVATDPRLVPLREPEVVVDVEVTAPRPDDRPGWALLRCRYGLAGDRVASTAWAGGPVEVAAYGVEHWQTELARAATVRAATAAPVPVEDHLEAPLEVVLGAAEAVHSGRPDVVDELVRRCGADDPGALRTQLTRLHTASVGRLLGTVAARDGATARTGWTSWLLFGDGWRSLAAVRRDDRRVVRVARATPPRLGVEVAALVTLVRGRS